MRARNFASSQITVESDYDTRTFMRSPCNHAGWNRPFVFYCRLHVHCKRTFTLLWDFFGLGPVQRFHSNVVACFHNCH